MIEEQQNQVPVCGTGSEKPDLKDYKPIISKNILELRVSQRMTQAELAEKLHYSDKAVSKWERGESLPDIAVLAEVAGIFGVTLDDLIRDREEEERKAAEEAAAVQGGTGQPEEAMNEEPPAAEHHVSGQDQDPAGAENSNLYIKRFETLQKQKKFRHAVLTVTGIILVWLVAYMAFTIVRGTLSSSRWNWLIFIYALPCSGIVWLIFNSIWFKKGRNYLILSLLMWSILAAIELTALMFGKNLWPMLLAGIPMQIIFFIWSMLGRKEQEEEST